MNMQVHADRPEQRPGQNNGQGTQYIPPALLLRSALDLASVLTEINSAAAKAGSVLADAYNILFSVSAS